MDIVCGLDFSPAALQAARAAAKLAARIGQRLVVVHAHDERRERAMPGDAAGHGSAALDAAVAELRARGGGEVVGELVAGPADEALVRVARARGASMIVVAAHGHRGWFVGNVAARAAQTADAPVLVIRDPGALESAAAPSFARWLDGGTLRVIAGVDFGVDVRGLVAWLGRLRQAGRCDVVVAHAASLHVECVRRGVWEVEGLTELPRRIQEPMLAELRARIPALPGEGTLEHRVLVGFNAIDRQLIDFASDEHADVLVVGTHPRSRLERAFRGTMADAALNAAPMSVACVPLARERIGRPSPVPRYRRLLAAVDLDADDGRALSFAVGLAERGGTVTALAVRERAADPLDGDGSLRERLRALIPGEADAAGVTVSPLVLPGPRVAEVIGRQAEELGVDAIVLGTRAARVLGAGAVGSVTREVLGSSRREVIVVQPPLNP
jgi:nucleotide-binding universal stress UspA family protein